MRFEGEGGYVHDGDVTGFDSREALFVLALYVQLYGPDTEV